MNVQKNLQTETPTTVNRIEKAVRASLENIRRDLLQCVESGELTVFDGERSVESVGVVDWECFDVAVCCEMRGPLVPEPEWKTTLEIRPSAQTEAAMLFSRLQGKAAEEGIKVLRLVAIYADAKGYTVHGIPVVLQRKTEPQCWRLAVQYRVVMD